MANRIALITGASSGIGYSTAIELQSKGYTVYGAARRVDRMGDLQKKESIRFRLMLPVMSLWSLASIALLKKKDA